MPRTASSIIQRALQISKAGSVVNGQATGYVSQALDCLNDALENLCLKQDFALARGEFNFSFNTNLVSSGQGNIITAAPNMLPLDYLRTSGSSGSTGIQNSSIWYIQGVPYPMMPCDLAEFDLQVQQAGIQSYPWLWATDMSLQSIALVTTGDLNPASQTVANVPSTTGLYNGISVSGTGIVPGTTVLSFVSNTSVTLSQAPSVTAAQATLMFGTPPVGYPYPPPSGAYPVMIRYQRLMPPLTQAQVNAGAYPWFPDSDLLVEATAGRLMEITDDSRVTEFLGDGVGNGGRVGRRLAEYNREKDDLANRSQTVQLDRRVFGPTFANLPNSKRVGW